MNIQKTIAAFYIGAFLCFPSCKNASEQTGKIDSGDINITATASDHKADPGSLPQFTFTEEAHDFGKITQGEKVSYSFKFKNTGGTDLLINEAHGSCGCTVPQYPKQPVPPGSESAIDVTFDSDGKSGKVEKTVTLTANTSPNTKVIKIMADIQVPEEK